MMKIQCSCSLIPTRNGRQRSMMFHNGTLTSVVFHWNYKNLPCLLIIEHVRHMYSKICLKQSGRDKLFIM